MAHSPLRRVWRQRITFRAGIRDKRGVHSARRAARCTAPGEMLYSERVAASCLEWASACPDCTRRTQRGRYQPCAVRFKGDDNLLSVEQTFLLARPY